MKTNLSFTRKKPNKSRRLICLYWKVQTNSSAAPDDASINTNAKHLQLQSADVVHSVEMNLGKDNEDFDC